MLAALQDALQQLPAHARVPLVLALLCLTLYCLLLYAYVYVLLPLDTILENHPEYGEATLGFLPAGHLRDLTVHLAASLVLCFDLCSAAATRLQAFCGPRSTTTPVRHRKQ